MEIVHAMLGLVSSKVSLTVQQVRAFEQESPEMDRMGNLIVRR